MVLNCFQARYAMCVLHPSCPAPGYLFFCSTVERMVVALVTVYLWDLCWEEVLLWGLEKFPAPSPSCPMCFQPPPCQWQSCALPALGPGGGCCSPWLTAFLGLCRRLIQIPMKSVGSLPLTCCELWIPPCIPQARKDKQLPRISFPLSDQKVL